MRNTRDKHVDLTYMLLYGHMQYNDHKQLLLYFNGFILNLL